MELSHFIKILKKYSLFIVILVVLGAIIGFLSSDFFASGFRRNQTYFVSEKSQTGENTPNFNSEAYFQQEKLRNATDSLVAVLESEDFQNEALTSQDSLQVRKLAPRVIRLTYLSQSQENATANLDTVIDKFNDKITTLSEDNTNFQLKPIGASSAPIYSKLNSLTLLAAGALIAAAFALFIVGLKEYNNL